MLWNNKNTRNLFLCIITIVVVIGIIVSIILLYPRNICLEDAPEYKNRMLISTSPKHKLKAYCISLKDKHKNRDFIRKEWKEFLDIVFFEALSNCTESHKHILSYLWKYRHHKQHFPVVIMEDDVFRMGDFTKYWDLIYDYPEADYITFDVTHVDIDENHIKKDFITLKKHNSAGFIVYNQRFFQRFKTLEDLHKSIGDLIDTNLTHDQTLVKYHPRKQVCRQVVSKYSTTSKMNNYIQNLSYRTAKNKIESV
jgi:hypothetical protein